MEKLKSALFGVSFTTGFIATFALASAVDTYAPLGYMRGLLAVGLVSFAVAAAARMVEM